MVRVLFLLHGLPCGGTESALYNLLSAIDEKIFDVTVYVYYAGGDFYNAFKEMCETKGFRLKKMFHEVKPGGSFLQKLRNYYYFYIVEPQKFKHPRRFYKAALDGEYDIEVAFTFFGTPIIIGASPNPESKKVAWIHGDMSANSWCMMYYKDKEEQAKNYLQFDQIVCVSESVKNAFVKELGDNPALMVLHNPVNTKKIREMARENPEEMRFRADDRTLCAVGRLSHEKGFDRLIRIHKQLIDEGVLHKLMIVGDGEDRPKLESLINELQVHNTVCLVGYDSNPYRYMAASRCLVCSSYTEGLPIVAQEALILGKPVVSSHPSVLEIFEGKQCGIVSGMRDDELKDALKEILTDEALYQDCLKNAEQVGGKIEYHSMVRDVEKMLLALVSEN